jgi:outer membrane immunogenic protein
MSCREQPAAKLPLKALRNVPFAPFSNGSVASRTHAIEARHDTFTVLAVINCGTRIVGSEEFEGRGWIMKTLLIAGVIWVAAAANAYAADMSPPPPAPPPLYTKAPPPVVYPWTGFYVGVNGGWVGSGNSNITNSVVDTGGPFGGGLGTSFAGGIIPSSISLSNSGGLVGGTAGYNWQVNTTLVLGLEGDLDWVSAKNSTIIGPLAAIGFAPVTTTASRQLDWLGTFRGRLGFTPTASLLIYGTGGLAVGEHQLGIAAAGPTFFPPLSVGSTTQTTSAGWTAGGGIEWKFAPQWSVKAEYLYVDLGNINATTNSYNYVSFISGLPATGSLTARVHDTYNIARVGLNYTFGGPLAAHY